MTYDSQKYHRRSLRLTGYDYSQAGAYFITACAQDRVCLFGEVVGGEMHLNDAGRMVLAEWNSLPVRFPGLELDEFGVMPNHIHGIITIAHPVPGPPPPRLGDIVGAFKSLTTDLYIQAVKHSGWPPFPGRLWQRNYHEHVIRSETSLNRIRQYILDNPASWTSDLEHPEAERPKQKTA